VTFYADDSKGYLLVRLQGSMGRLRYSVQNIHTSRKRAVQYSRPC